MGEQEEVRPRLTHDGGDGRGGEVVVAHQVVRQRALAHQDGQPVEYGQPLFRIEPDA